MTDKTITRDNANYVMQDISRTLTPWLELHEKLIKFMEENTAFSLESSSSTLKQEMATDKVTPIVQAVADHIGNVCEVLHEHIKKGYNR